MKDQQQNFSTISFHFLLCSTLLFVYNQALATDMGELNPEADVGLAVESLPDSVNQKTPVLTIKTVSGEPQIDGIIDDKFREQARPFDLNIGLYSERLLPVVVKTEALMASGLRKSGLPFVNTMPAKETTLNVRYTARLKNHFD